MAKNVLLLFVMLCFFISGCKEGNKKSTSKSNLETSGTPGSPFATTTIDGKQLPNPPFPFEGKIDEDAKNSKAYWPPNIVPPKGAPNILLIMTDDQGYGISGTFGGVIPTPSMDKLAKSGIRYTQFHSTALCSPSRAALITGRNHHSVGFGVIIEQSTGFPGYDGIVSLNSASIGSILKYNGYATSWFGKDHNVPTNENTNTGPYDNWPSGMGFEYFYGFVGGETDQYKPYLFQNTTQIYPWKDDPNYNMITGMADNAIEYLDQLNSSDPERPFFLYYVPGGTHAPHQPKAEWRDKFKGKFDMGWNKMREEIFANQKRLGVIPQNTQLTPWPDDLPKWETLDTNSKKMFARQAENFAGYVAYTDNEIGRVIQKVEDMGKTDNTLIIYISGDNGTSAEGTAIGTAFDMAAIQAIEMPIDEQLKYYDVWGGPETTPHMSVAWSWAFDTPFKWTKQIASHFGGTRQGMVMSWPKKIKDVGSTRSQFHHLIDIVPTILEATGIPAPEMVNGIQQKPIEGVSMAYTWDKSNEKAPSTRKTQYFEMFCNRGIYNDGWYACTTPPQPPWLMGLGKFPPINDYKWELYNLTDDYSQFNDLASQNPDKLKELQALFITEAKKYQVLPLDNSVISRLLAPRPNGTQGRTDFTYTGPIKGITYPAAPDILTKSFTITADVDIPQAGTEGMLVTLGGRMGGWGLYVLKGKPVFTYNMLALEKFKWQGADALTPGKHTIVFDFKYDGPGAGKSGTGILSVDGKEVANNKIPNTIPFLLTIFETFDIGSDTRTPVDDADYQVPFKFTGTISKINVKLGKDQLMADSDKLMRQNILAMVNY
jgi:arylsulfatase A-like enzyme